MALPPLPLLEIAAVVVGTLGLFVLLALVSYHPTDPSWNRVGGDAGPRNWMGQVGASLSDSLIQLIGIPAIVVPAGLLILSVTLFKRESSPGAWFRVLAGGSLTLFAALLLALYPGELALRGGNLQTGGWFGNLIVGELKARLNTVGTLVVVLAGLLLSLQLTLALQVGPAILRLLGIGRQLTVGAARLTGGAVAYGAGAMTDVATSGAVSLGQRIRDSVDAHREEMARWKQERALADQDRVDDEPSPAKSAPTAARPGLASEEERRAQRERPRLPVLTGSERVGPERVGPERVGPAHPVPDRQAEASSNQGIEPGRRTGSGGGAESAPGSITQEGAPVGELPRQLPLVVRNVPVPLESSLEDDEPEPPASVATGSAPVRPPAPRPGVVSAGTASVELGPKIIKSRYLEERGGYGDDDPEVLRSADFELPSVRFLKSPPAQEGMMSEEELFTSARLLEDKLKDYGVEGQVVEIHPGPVITMYEYAPAPGVKVSKITNLSNDLALALRATAVRIVAPLPGKAAVGIEVPNTARQTVYLREVIESEEFRTEKLKLPMAVGKDIEGRPYAGDMARMPHLLVAGSTGAGKSVAVNAMLISLLYARKPEDVRLILVDPKMIEFSVYNDIPHLLMPVVTDPKKAAAALNWGVEEMTRRYQLLTLEGARNIASYNTTMEERLKTWDPEKAGDAPLPQKLPYIVIVIDELADLMMVAGKEVQDAIVRLAQMARAAGIHLIVATQRPSVDVITGLIKANFPARIAFKVSSKTDSRTILDANGAEYLLGNGDMLHLPPGSASLIRLHGAFVSDEEARVVAEHLRKQGQPRYEESLLASTSDDAANAEDEAEEDYDEKYEEAKVIVLETGQASISTIQRRLRIGYNRSARMVERMAKEGLIGPPTQGGKPREIFAAKLQASLRL